MGQCNQPNKKENKELYYQTLDQQYLLQTNGDQQNINDQQNALIILNFLSTQYVNEQLKAGIKMSELVKQYEKENINVKIKSIISFANRIFEVENEIEQIFQENARTIRKFYNDLRKDLIEPLNTLQQNDLTRVQLIDNILLLSLQFMAESYHILLFYTDPNRRFQKQWWTANNKNESYAMQIQSDFLQSLAYKVADILRQSNQNNQGINIQYQNNVNNSYQGQYQQQQYQQQLKPSLASRDEHNNQINIQQNDFAEDRLQVEIIKKTLVAKQYANIYLQYLYQEGIRTIKTYVECVDQREDEKNIHNGHKIINNYLILASDGCRRYPKKNSQLITNFELNNQ